MITLRDLINSTDFNDVWVCMTRHYEIKNENSYKNFKILYEKLSKIALAQNTSNMFVYINAFKEGEDGDTYNIIDFDEDDNILYFDVCGKDDEHCGYSLVSSFHEEWVNFFIDEQTLSRFTYSNIIAHCLWEMTFFGFEQRRDEEGILIIDQLN